MSDNDLFTPVGNLLPRVWNRKHWYPRNAQYVGRGTPWGNPFVIGLHGNRDECVDRFEREILPDLDVEMLRGRDLVCSCVPKRCHATSIFDKANS